jgi:uracil-DNA glycosylase family 4
MTDIFHRLNNEVLHDLRKCKKNKTCEGLTCRTFYFEPNEFTIKKWREEEGFYKKGIDRRVIFVGERPGPNNEVLPNDTKVYPCFKVNDANRRVAVARKLQRFHDVRKKYGFENCCLTNIVKCSKFSGTDKPSVDEINECSRHLINEIKIIQPEVVVAVGDFQYKTLGSKKFKFKEIIESQGGKLHKITHWAFRYWALRLSEAEFLERWDREFRELKGIISPSPKYIPIM